MTISAPPRGAARDDETKITEQTKTQPERQRCCCVVVVIKSTHTIPYRPQRAQPTTWVGSWPRNPPSTWTHIPERRARHGRTHAPQRSSTGSKLASLKRRHAGPPHSRCGVLRRLWRNGLPCGMLNHGVRHARSRSTRYRAIPTPRPRGQAESIHRSHPRYCVA